jgi:hypothetical protein
VFFNVAETRRTHGPASPESVMSNRRSVDKAEIEALHAQRFGYMSILKTRFTVPHLVGMYRHFDGDLALAIVLGEIAIRNLQALYQMRPEEPYQVLDPVLERALGSRFPSSEDLRPANALSIATATGIPRETVRRKVAKLIERGWVRRDEHGLLFVTERVGDELRDFDREETVRFALAASALLDLIETE